MICLIRTPSFDFPVAALIEATKCKDLNLVSVPNSIGFFLKPESTCWKEQTCPGGRFFFKVSTLTCHRLLRLCVCRHWFNLRTATIRDGSQDVWGLIDRYQTVRIEFMQLQERSRKQTMTILSKSDSDSNRTKAQVFFLAQWRGVSRIWNNFDVSLLDPHGERLPWNKWRILFRSFLMDDVDYFHVNSVKSENNGSTRWWV